MDSQFTVKIADLELGVLRSREGLRDPVTAPTHNHPEPLTLSRSAKGPHDELMSAFSDPNYVQVEELLANWMAPDVRFLYISFYHCPDIFKNLRSSNIVDFNKHQMSFPSVQYYGK